MLTALTNHAKKGYRNAQRKGNPMADKPNTPAQDVKFHMTFAVQMLNIGRMEMANESFAKANAILESMIERGA